MPPSLKICNDNDSNNDRQPSVSENDIHFRILGAAEWAAMSEKERQAELLRKRLEQKRLMREGKLEEAAKLLGEGFAADANLKKLMGQNRAK